MKNRDQELFGIAFADIMISFAGFIFMLFVVVSLLPHKESDNDNSVMLGSLCAELYWDNTRNVDLDIWGKSPKDEAPIGYSNMHGKGLDLYRDVLGFDNNPEHINMEILCTNKIYPGEYTFNVTYFSDHENLSTSSPNYDINHKPRIDATMIIRLKGDSPSDGRTRTLKSVYTLNNESEEKTMFNFRVDNNGKIIESSINSVDKPLRNLK
jgi:hypothetical protein